MSNEFCFSLPNDSTVSLTGNPKIHLNVGAYNTEVLTRIKIVSKIIIFFAVLSNQQ